MPRITMNINGHNWPGCTVIQTYTVVSEQFETLFLQEDLHSFLHGTRSCIHVPLHTTVAEYTKPAIRSKSFWPQPFHPLE